LDRICEFLALTPSLTKNVTHGPILERFCGRLQAEFFWLFVGNTGRWSFVSITVIHTFLTNFKISDFNKEHERSLKMI